MTDKMIAVPRELLEELRDCANDCYNYESALSYSRSTRVNFYEDLVEQCDALLREAAQPEQDGICPDCNGVGLTGGQQSFHAPDCRTCDGTGLIGGPLDEAVRKSWSRYCNAIAKSPDAPYPGMIESFERHYSQDFRDPEWRSEAGTWAAAWKSAIATTSKPDDLEAMRRDAEIHTCRVGIYGAAYDLPETCRAYTYKHQPLNGPAWRIGEAAMKASMDPAGDFIDTGLNVLRHLEDVGFGVFEIRAAPSHEKKENPND